MKTFAVLTFAAFAAGTLCAQTTQFAKPADWNISGGQRKIEQAGAALKIAESSMIVTSKHFTIDPAKTYTIQATVKNTGKIPTTTFFGFMPISSKGLAIHTTNVKAIPGTDTQLAAPLKKGDSALVVKDAAKWNAAGVRFVFYNTKPDFSDLPSTTYIPFAVKSVVKTGNNWTVTLAKPSNIALPAGTNVRIHAAGGWMYSGGYKQLKPGESFTFKGSASGILAKPGYLNAQFPVGSKFFRVLMLVNYSSKGAVSEISDVSLTVK